MLFATLDVDLVDDIAFTELYDADPGHPWRFLRLIQIAKRHGPAHGRIQRADAHPLTPKQLARLHDPRTPNGEQLWESFLSLCIELGLIIKVNDTYTVNDWRRWHRSPSDEPGPVRERVAKKRAKEKQCNEPVTTCNEPVTTCNEPVTTCNELVTRCNELVTSVTGQSIAEQSIAEHNRAEHSSQSMRARAHEGPTDVFLALGKKICEEFEPGSTFSRRRQQDVAEIVANIGSSSFGGEQVREDDVRNAMLMAAALTRKRRQTDGVTNPWAYWVSTAKQKICECVEFRFTHELQQKAIQNSRFTVT